MGRKCMEEGKKRSTHLHIRMTLQERGTLERVANCLNKNVTDIVLDALSLYYGQILSEAKFNYVFNGGDHHE